MELAGKFVRIAYRELRPSTGQSADIAHLSAGLGVERRAVGQHDRLVAGGDRLDRAAILQQRHDLQAGGIELVIAQELSRDQLRHQVGRQRRAAAELAGRARGLALLFH